MMDPEQKPGSGAYVVVDRVSRLAPARTLSMARESRRSSFLGKSGRVTVQLTCWLYPLPGHLPLYVIEEHKNDGPPHDDLWSRNLIQLEKVISLQRDAARTEGELGQLQASVAEAKGKVAETELQILQVDRNLQGDVSKDLSEIRGKISELSERKIAAEDQLKRIMIRAPQTGVVYQVTVHTMGGVMRTDRPHRTRCRQAACRRQDRADRH